MTLQSVKKGWPSTPLGGGALQDPKTSVQRLLRLYLGGAPPNILLFSLLITKPEDKSENPVSPMSVSGRGTSDASADSVRTEQMTLLSEELKNMTRQQVQETFWVFALSWRHQRW